MPLQEVLIEGMQDLYIAEQSLIATLPPGGGDAAHPELQYRFQQQPEWASAVPLLSGILSLQQSHEQQAASLSLAAPPPLQASAEDDEDDEEDYDEEEDEEDDEDDEEEDEEDDEDEEDEELDEDEEDEE